MTRDLAALFTPGTIGTLSVRNRIAMPPMATNYATWTGAVTDRLIAYHAARARGGVGLITVEFTYVQPTGRLTHNGLGVYEDALIPGLRRLTDAVHAEGAKVSIQIAHGGRRCRSTISGTQPLAPSPIPCLGGEVPRGLSEAEIDRVIVWFGEAARRVREAGFDAVTLHLAAGYLLQSFLSPYANRRTDQYGGSLEGRMRLPLAILERVRCEVGPEFPVICRLTVDEFVEGGLTLAEAQRMAQRLEQGGAAAIDATAGLPETLYIIGPPMAMPRGFLASHAQAIKAAVRIPVFAVGRINDPRLAEQLLQEGKADFICMGRALLADPELPNKAKAGRLDDICPCIACNEGCNQRFYAQLDVSCVVNPRVGREPLFPATPASQSRRVLVIGGGPAGLMAALSAAARGHRVTLCERTAQLGGQLLMGDVPPHKEEIRTLREYLIGQLAKAGVEIRLQTPGTPELVRASGAEVVIVATGAKPLPPQIPAVDSRVISAWDVLAGREPVGATVVVLGGGEVGCELAEYLATQGKGVWILEMLPDLAANMEPRGRALLVQRLRHLGVKVLLQSRIEEVRGSTVTYTQGGLKQQIAGIESVVSAVGSASNRPLGESPGAPGATVHCIGDCVKPRRILEAMREGFEISYAL
jgi:2,4-dienoyl-CoA reductase-like NADH-dependent reductase (Old Yellow Enzyme family)/thioredoxin reductase